VQKENPQSVRPLSADDRGLASWRTPTVVVVCGCLIAMIGFGPRSALGLFLTPMSAAHGWERDIFALSVAMQTLLYGAAQPFSARSPTASAPCG